MFQTWILMGFTIAGVAIIMLGFGYLVFHGYRKVDQGNALIINKVRGEPEVTFTGGLVYPILHRAEVMDISVKTIEIDRRGKDGLICSDNIRADIKVTFFVRVNKTVDDVLKVAQAIGCARASQQGTLEDLFQAKFSEALKTVGKRLEFEDLYKERDSFKDSIIEVIGRDLNGYALEDAAIDFLEQTPLEAMDPNNILDAQGIRKITELTTVQNVMTNDLRQTERKAMKKQNVEAEEAVLALDRQQADAVAKQQREINTMKAREEAETKRVQAEEFKKAELARIKAKEEVEINEENRQRQVQVAQKNRERVIAVETERVEKDRQIEVIAREREVALNTIAKEKEVEVEKKEIADVIRARIAVDKTVAEEEERIKDLRVVAEAKRTKEAMIIGAEAEAQESLVKTIKSAEAQSEVAKFKAKETLTLAEADLEASDKRAKAKIRLAEGVQAEEAASGLAKVRVREADAVAIEKTEQQGRAQASVLREKGLADAVAIEKRLAAEATGLAQKADAMKALDGVGREHEEFRINLEKEKDVELRSIEARTEIAKNQAEIMKEAFSHAKINIVGGDGQFFDRFIKAVSLGQSVDGALDHSNTLDTIFKDYTSGKSSFPQDLKDVLSRPALDAGTLQSLSLSALLGKLMVGADDPIRQKIQTLIDQARELGIDDLPQAKSKKN
jgi:uncharacterized membrane protein YqiK